MLDSKTLKVTWKSPNSYHKQHFSDWSMEKPHGSGFEDESSDIKWEKGSTIGVDLPSCGSATGKP